MLCCVTAVCLCKTIEKSVLGESLFSVLRDSILNPILDSLFSIFYFVIHVVKDWKVYCQSFSQTLTEIEYSTPFIHIGSSGAFLFFCLGKQSKNNEALNSE